MHGGQIRAQYRLSSVEVSTVFVSSQEMGQSLMNANPGPRSKYRLLIANLKHGTNFGKESNSSGKWVEQGE